MIAADRSMAIVTGAASGIGLATTQALLALGWQVAACDRDEKALARAQDALSSYGDRVRLSALDVTDERAVGDFVVHAAKLQPVLRGIVTCAGIASNATMFDATPEQFRRIYEVNVIGSFTVARAAADIMRHNGGGAIVTIASVSGLVGNLGRAAYGASKGAIVNLTRIMAVELARSNVRVNAIAPGPIETAMAREVHSAKARAEWNRRVPMGRYGTPEEVAQAACFLIDPLRSSYITGQVLAVDGGFVVAGLLDSDV